MGTALALGLYSVRRWCRCYGDAGVVKRRRRIVAQSYNVLGWIMPSDPRMAIAPLVSFPYAIVR